MTSSSAFRISLKNLVSKLLSSIARSPLQTLVRDNSHTSHIHNVPFGSNRAIPVPRPPSVPAVARRDGFARLDGAQVRHVQVLDLVPLGYPSADLNHLVAKRCGELGSQVSPDDDLDVARLILSP